MSSNIEDRVVKMSFDNQQFERGIKTTLDSLSNLNKSLSQLGSVKGLANLANVGKSFSVDGISQGLDALINKFNTLSVVGLTTLTNIVNKAVNAGTSLLKSLTIDPISTGLSEYETKLGSIQTILANTGSKGTTLSDVNASLKELNEYSDQTIYNFKEMARNIGTFTAAGVGLEPATAAIKGIANLAAVSGSSSEQASSAMYQLSQAMATGTVRLMDWNSVVYAGMGGEVFQKSLMETARVHGVAIDDIVKKEGSFRDSLSTGWLSTEILTETLSKFTGDVTAAQLKQMGYTDQQIVGILKMAQTAKDAATKVKTFSQLTATLGEVVGSGWAETWELIFGDIDEAKKLWSGVNDVVGGFIQTSADARNKVLGDWKALGGRTALIEGIGSAFKALMSVVTPIKDAFREVFPATTGKQLADITKAFRDFMKTLALGPENMDKLKRTFKGIFSILAIGWDILKGVTKLFFSMFKVVGSGTGGFLSITASIGDFLTKIREWLASGDKISSFFDGLIAARESVLKPLVAFVSKLGDAFGSLLQGDASGFLTKLSEAFSQFGPIVEAIQNRIASLLGFFATLSTEVGKFLTNVGVGVASPIVALFDSIASSFKTLMGAFSGFSFDLDTSGIAGASDKMTNFAKLGESATKVWDGFTAAFAKVISIFDPIIDSIGAVFKSLSEKITEYMRDLDFQDAVALLNTGFFIALYIAARSFLKKMSELFDNIGEIFTGVIDALGSLTDVLKGMQQNLKANIILKIALAIGILAGAVYVLAGIDAEALKKAVLALGVLFIQLGLMLKLFSTLDFASSKGVLTAVGSLILLAVAVKVLADAVKKISDLSWEQLAKGLIGVAVLLAAITLFTKFAEADGAGLAQGAGIILIALAIKILVSSIADLGSMDLATLAKGIGSLGLIFGALVVLVTVLNGSTGIFAASVGLLILAAALMALSISVRIYAAIDFGTLVAGLGGMALALLMIGGSMRAMPKNMPALAIGMVILSGALVILAGALKIMGNMSVLEIGKALIVLAGSLAVLAIAVNLMNTAIPGAKALVIVSAALVILTAVLKTLGDMEWDSIVKGLVAIAGVFVIIGLAGYLLGPIVPVIAALAVALNSLGIAMLLAGAGFLAFAIGFAILAAVGTAGFAVLIAGFEGLLALIPLFAQQIALGIIAFAKIISDAGPVLVEALTVILLSLLKAIDNVAPKFFDTVGRLVMGMVNKIVELIPKIAEAGIKMLLKLLDAIDRNIYRITTTTLSIITKFIKGIGDGLPDIIDAGAKLLVKFLEGIADAIEENAEKIGEAGGEVALAMIHGMVNGLWSLVGTLVEAAVDVASQAWEAVKGFLGINSPSKKFHELGVGTTEGFRDGIDDSAYMASDATVNMGRDAIDSLRKALGDVSTIGGLLNVSPVITPVLDLTSVEQESRKLGNLLGVPNINVGSAYSAATGIANRLSSAETVKMEVKTPVQTQPTFSFTQNNTSPKALSTSEIYRNTRSQISIAKGVLADVNSS